MRNLFLFLSVLLLGVTWAVAQSSTSPSSSSSSSAGQSTSSGYGQSSTSAGGEKTVEGCLSGSSGSYTLTAKNGKTYQLTGDTAKLSEHVGHEVKITGTPSSGSSAGSTASTASGSTGEQSLSVTSVHHISKTCESGSSGMSH